MSFYLSAWIATFAYGFVAIIVKLTSKYSIPNPWLFNFLFQLFVLLIMFPIALINHAGWPTHWESIIIASVFFALFYLLYTMALYRLDVTVFAPLFNFRAVMSVFLAWMFLGEKLTFNQTLLIIVIFIAGLFSSVDEKFSISSFFKPAIGIAIASVTSLALNNLFIKKAIIDNGYWQLLLWQYIISQILLLTTVGQFKKDIHKLSLKQVGAVLLVAIIFVIGELTSTRAYAENVGISSVIISLPASMIMAFLFSVFAPKLLEKHTLKIYAIRFTAAIIMIVSALQLSK